MMWPISIQQNFFAHLRAHSSEYVDVDIRRIGIAASKTGQSPTQMGMKWDIHGYSVFFWQPNITYPKYLDILRQSNMTVQEHMIFYK